MSLSNRQEIESWEARRLAGYAAQAAASRGRSFPMPEHPLRTAYQRDRDRIIHAAAFRRMEHKTQVFLPTDADHFRTRLTHTIEVAQIVRTLARNLRVNEDLAEAIALVHDLGHTPFGHTGEDILDELLVDSGGFNHNRQSLRVVDLLEQRYAEHPGLNLTYEVREGIAKHETKVKIVAPEFDSAQRPTLEALLVDKADEIAYSAHDVDDGLNSGLISFDDLRDLTIWQPGGGKPGLPLSGGVQSDQERYVIVRYLIDTIATDLLTHTNLRLESLGISSIDLLRSSTETVCSYSSDFAPRVAELKERLLTRLYHHPFLLKRKKRAHEIIEELYTTFTEKPERMPLRFQEMMATEELSLVVADYIAGMTDRYAEKQVADLGSE